MLHLKSKSEILIPVAIACALVAAITLYFAADSARVRESNNSLETMLRSTLPSFLNAGNLIQVTSLLKAVEPKRIIVMDNDGQVLASNKSGVQIGTNVSFNSELENQAVPLVFNSQQVGKLVIVSQSVLANDPLKYALLIATSFLLLCSGFLMVRLRVASDEKLHLATQVAHDIRSPLSVLALATSGFDGAQDERAKLIKAATIKLQKIAEDLLGSERKRLVSAVEPIPRALEVIQNVIREKRIEIQGFRNVNFELLPEVGPELTVTSIESIRLQRVLSNLLNNSIEAVGDGGLIKIRIEKTKEQNLAISILDNGIGMTPNQLVEISKLSFNSTKISGNGLGLKDAINQVWTANGSISLNSSVDKGTLLKIQLPLRSRRLFVPRYLKRERISVGTL